MKKTHLLAIASIVAVSLLAIGSIGTVKAQQINLPDSFTVNVIHAEIVDALQVSNQIQLNANELLIDHTKAVREQNQLIIDSMSYSTEIWYEGYNDRVIQMFKQKDHRTTTGFSCGYFDILTKEVLPQKDC